MAEDWPDPKGRWRRLDGSYLNGKGRFGGKAIAVLTLAALLFFLGLGNRPLRSPEGRWAEVSREMQLNSNYFRPTINGRVYYGKPLLSYWLVAGASYITGGISELGARIPSAVAGLLGVALLMFTALRLYDYRTALLAGFILATSFAYFSFARKATADMETVVGILAALALYVANKDRQTGWWVVGLWLVMAVTSLFKSLLGIVLPLLVLGAYSLFRQGWGGFVAGTLTGSLRRRLEWLAAQGRWFFNRRTPLAIALAAIVYCLPFAISYMRLQSNIGFENVWHENFIRFVNPFDHKGPAYLYTYALFWLMAPWSVFLPAALVEAHVKPRNESDRFALVYFWATFVFFTLSGSRRAYYLLPILPAGALLVSRVFYVGAEGWDVRSRMLLRFGYILLSVVALAAGALVLAPAGWWSAGLPVRTVLSSPLIFALFWGMVIVILLYAFPTFRPMRVVRSTSAFAYLGLLFLILFGFPAVEPHHGKKAFAHSARQEVNGDLRDLVLYKVWAPGLLFYLSPPGPIRICNDQRELEKFVKYNPDTRIILYHRDLRTLPFHGSVVGIARSFNMDKIPHLRNHLALFKPEAAGNERDHPELERTAVHFRVCGALGKAEGPME